MHARIRSARGPCAALLLALAAGACTDRNALGPELEPDAGLARITCRVDVRASTLTCDQPRPVTPQGVNAQINLGGQEKYVKLASSGTSYDGGTELLQSSVTVQNLLAQAMGTNDGVTVQGVYVYFNEDPVVTSGTGTVALSNADGFQTFTAANQAYFLYNEILDPYEISGARTWFFSVPATVNTFQFTLYVSTTLQNETISAFLDKVWDGVTDTDWFTATNWSDDAVPDSASTVSVPADSLLASANFPVLTANAAITNVRVGFGSTLGLGGFTLTAWGNVEGVGTISNGTVWMRGSNVLLKGNVPATILSGGTALQGATFASGAMSISDGSLTTAGQPLTISIP